MSGNNIRNVLVLRNGSVATLEFVNLFGAYLQYDNYEDSLKWRSNLSEVEVVDDIKSSTMVIGNKRFKFIHAPALNFASQQTISILLHLMHKQKICAAIFLVNLLEMNNKSVWKYKHSILSKLNQIANKNILYLMMANDDSYKHVQLGSVFYFQKNKFYKLSNENWQKNVEFSKSIYNYIVGDKNTNGLQDYFIQSVVPVAAILKLADDLLEFLSQIYICAEYGKLSYDGKGYYLFYINNYKNNVTTCYDNNCIKWLQHHRNDQFKLKISKICHGPCKCSEFDNDVSRCTMFDTSDKTCLQCDCKSESHSKKCFEFSPDYSLRYNLDNEKCIAMKMLTTFYLYKQQNQQVYNIENIFLTLLDIQDTKHQTIFDNFKIKFNEEIQKFDEKPNVITCENILLCLKELYKITSKITPQFIEDIFPQDFRLEVITDERMKMTNNVETECETRNVNNETMEALRNENIEMKQMLQNANDLNSKLLQDMHTLTKKRRLDEEEKQH